RSVADQAEIGEQRVAVVEPDRAECGIGIEHWWPFEFRARFVERRDGVVRAKFCRVATTARRRARSSNSEGSSMTNALLITGGLVALIVDAGHRCFGSPGRQVRRRRDVSAHAPRAIPARDEC